MIPDSGIMEGKSVASSTLPKVPVNGAYAMLAPDRSACSMYVQDLRTYVNSISSFIVETTTPSIDEDGSK